MLPKEQIKLLEAWNKDIFGQLSISEIMSISKKRTKPWVFNSLKQLTKYNLLASKRKANINLYSLNLNNPLLIQTLQYLEAQNLLDFPHLDIITELINKIPLKNYSLLAFGNYTKNNLNICFLIENKQAEKEINSYLNRLKLSSHTKITPHYITFHNFISMLLTEEENLAKKIFSSHKLFFNADIYYQLLKEAYKKGFRQ